ncbi:MAG: hypothetical protein LBQ47_03995 [Endomicrobium sp.]|jgi:acetyl-CoA carboxylase biotin carboxyl carrier protein|nr:hypothetical protein [Endomicrobium sp.]
MANGNESKNDIKSKVQSLYEIMKEEKISELEVNCQDYNVCIKRKDPDAERIAVKKAQPVSAAENKTAGAPQNNSVSVSAETVKSPITGIFYQSPSPSSAAFVSAGDIVEIGKALCIVEAMKVMNEIKATYKAKIVKVIAENGKIVSAGQDLFEVEKL